MEKLFLTDYLIKANKKFKKGAVNLIVSPAGSGKSTFITGENGLINNTKQFYNEGIYEFFNFSQQKQRVLIITDNIMNKDVLSKEKGYQEVIYKDIFKAQNINCIEELLNNETGVINVMTYSKLVHLLKNEKSSKIIKTYIDLIVMDEIHNLFDYSLKFDNDNSNTGYFTIIDILNELAQNTLIIGLTATPQIIKVYNKNYSEVTIRHILSDSDVENIMAYTEDEKRTYFSIDNAIKDLCMNKIDGKVLIYTKKIATCKAYKEKLSNAGYNVEYLCAKDKMNKTQKDLRKYLIENELLPHELDILIINEAYQTGWNLKDNNVQTVIINDSDETAITQARNRVRHDIKLLIVKLYDINFGLNGVYDNCNQMHFIIDEKYLNRPLSTQEFNEVKNIYGTIRPVVKYSGDGVVNAYCSKTSFINQDLNSNGYVYKDKMIIKAEDENNADKELKKQLNKLVDTKLYKKDQKELAELVNIRRNGKLLKSIDSLNSYFKEYELPFLIVSTRIKEKGKLITIWKVKKVKK